jgi:hypothetical protein
MGSTGPPFDNLTLRDQFRDRLNAVTGIEIARAKLELRPSFPMTVLLDPEAYRGVVEALQWFVDVVRRAEHSAEAENAKVPIP